MSIHAIIDFETTGLSPNHGARPTEVAIVLIDEGKIIDRFQSLMNPGVPIPHEIQVLTGISNAMVRAAPKVESVMRDAVRFVGNHPMLAHNAAFDSKFWDAELRRINIRRKQEFACSMLLARRIFPEAPNHKLGTLVQTLGLPATGRYHRALADAEATAYLLLHIKQELQRRYRLATVSHELLVAIQSASRSQLETCVRRHQRAS
ncbi:MAG: 3'-5' exonuclease [Zoogloeaceae bacterium]|jgi:DNA polymerase-3 subunit epsilon|nr:3'-5' exonuclease [Zoogloeaceae bacterium]